MTITVVQSAGANGSTSGGFASNVTIGNSIIIWICGYNVTGNTITTSNPEYNGASVTGATAVVPDFQNTGSVPMHNAIWLLPNVQSSGTSVSFTITNSNLDGNMGWGIAEVSGLGVSPTLDSGSPNPVTASSNTSVGTYSSGSTGALVSSTGIALGCFMTDGGSGSNLGAGWTSVDASPWLPNGFGAAGYQIASSPGGTYIVSGTGGGGQWAASAATVVPNSGGSPVSFSGTVANIDIRANSGTIQIGSNVDRINPGPTWLHTFKPGYPAKPPLIRTESTIVFGLTAQANVAANFGTAVVSTPEAVSAVSVQAYFGNIIIGTSTEKVYPGPTWLRRFKPGYPGRPPLIETNNVVIPGTTATVSVVANFGSIKDTQLELVSNINIRANFGSISVKSAGSVSQVSTVPHFGTVKISKTGDISQVSVQSYMVQNTDVVGLASQVTIRAHSGSVINTVPVVVAKWKASFAKPMRGKIYNKYNKS